MSFSLRLSQDHDGRRLDRMLRSVWPELPLSAIMRAIRKGEVRLDSTRAREPGARVRGGQELWVPWEAPGERPAVPRRGAVPILWRGGCALVVNKPADLLVQPDVKDGDSVVTRVWSMLGTAEGGSPGFAPAAVHRLDRNTTGVLIVALRGDALRALEDAFRERLAGKRYLAIVVGRPSRELEEIDAPLLKDSEANVVRVSPEGKSARTRCRCLASDGGLSLVELELLTGRTHQARVHLAHVGCPILGDRKYGDFEANRLWRAAARRPLLHALELSFPDGLSPVLRELAGRSFRAPVPKDMRAIAVDRGWTLPADISCPGEDEDGDE